MKGRSRHCKPASIATTRWAAYTSAAIATALVGSNSAEAAIHYSGDLHEQFGPHKDKVKTFPLDQPGDSLVFGRHSSGSGGFDWLSVHGIFSHNFCADDPWFSYVYYAFRLPKDTNISNCRFPRYHQFSSISGRLAGAPNPGYWEDPGIGFVGFRFNNGAGVQYGWVRVRMSKLSQNAFTVLDYAYADPGEPITAGQRSSDEQIPDQGSLGWLAAGGVGLLAWRRSRSRTAR
jgi:hypothetical protein